MPPKRAQWDEKDLEKALEACESGTSQRLVAEQFKIPRRTLRNHIQSKQKFKKLGRHPMLTSEQEADFCSRIIRYSEVGMPLTAPTIKSYVFEYCVANNIPNLFNDAKGAAGRKWLAGFLKRNPSISLRKAQSMNPGRAAKLNKHIVQDYFSKLKAVMEQYDLFNKPQDIFNMDEKGCRLTLHHQQQVMAKKGAKRVHMVAAEHAENATLVVCANAAGNVIPPMVIFKGKRMKPEFADHLPPNSLVCMSDKGSMTTELFVQWVDHFSKFKPCNKVLLIFDGASSHLHPQIVDAAVAHDIVLFCLPSNTTHELQPLDKSVFKSFEHYWDIEVMKFWRTHPDRIITKSRFGSLCTPAFYKAVSMSNISNGFRATGIYPYDSSAIPDVAFAPSSLTFQEQDEPSSPSNINTGAEACSSAFSMDHQREQSLLLNTNNSVSVEACSSAFSMDHQREQSLLLNTNNSVSVEACSSTDFASSTSLCAFDSEVGTPASNMDQHSPNLSFTELMKTPKIKKKQSFRKKSLNYKAQVFNKRLFKNASKGSTKYISKTTGRKKKNNNVIKSASWFCAVCESEAQLSMRQCSKCQVWYHEECVGLDSDDDDMFTCMDCD
ncbi:uncharacterized protein LOC143470554 [Clavelina lepadiformis]|uniref:uncharacterized protein LOC143470554 n=1 Tax=Clavelina lepadiformis TaxID=159417 RepID=UPI00404217E5